MRIRLSELRRLVREEAGVQPQGSFPDALGTVLSDMQRVLKDLEAAHGLAPQGVAKAIIAGMHSDAFNSAAEMRKHVGELKKLSVRAHEAAIHEAKVRVSSPRQRDAWDEATRAFVPEPGDRVAYAWSYEVSDRFGTVKRVDKRDITVEWDDGTSTTVMRGYLLPEEVARGLFQNNSQPRRGLTVHVRSMPDGSERVKLRGKPVSGLTTAASFERFFKKNGVTTVK